MLLDTCAVIWLAQGGGELSRKALKAIDAAPAVFVCAISAFEVAHKYAAGGLDLPCDPGLWFKRVLEVHGLSEIPLTSDTAIAATRLPQHHRDPCDRFIIALAQMRRLPVVTHDRRFSLYGVEVIG